MRALIGEGTPIATKWDLDGEEKRHRHPATLLCPFSAGHPTFALTLTG